MKRYIDADKLIERCERLAADEYNQKVAPYSWAYAWESFIDDLVDEPIADVVEVRHGRWRVETDEEMPHPMFKLLVCSSCGATANKLYSFCPHCGAKMDGERKDDGTKTN